VFWQRRGESARALADFDDAVRLAPDNAAAVTARGVALGAKGEFDHALADFDRAIALEPDNANIYDDRGNVGATAAASTAPLRTTTRRSRWRRALRLPLQRSQAHHLAGRFNEAGDAAAAALNENARR
jgi:Flp pilus assembly protein TadD